MLDEAYNIVLSSGFNKLVMVRKKLSCRFGNKDMNTTLNCVQADGVMGTCWVNSVMVSISLRS